MIDETDLVKCGFKFGKNGAHSARSMMIEELKHLFYSRPEHAVVSDYQEDIVTFNTLHKPSANARTLTFRHLVDLYSLDMNVPLFNVLRRWWELDEKAQPVLALQLAAARDPILRGSISVITNLEPGEHLSRQTTEEYLAKDDPERFSPASLKSFAQNINGTWTQAGFLSGKTKKYREDPRISYVNVAFALYMAHCHGISGQRLFDTIWCKMLCKDKDSLFDLAQRASLRGIIKYKHASEVIEVTFPELPKVMDN